ncbi:hypothetical protein KY345_03340, partial [Candidatus Woesearchaeota archaeon]|nr:hypothetical protein [Candidatus Woesearchaeota archaeon]
MKSVIENLYNTLKRYTNPIAVGVLSAAVTVGSVGCASSPLLSKKEVGGSKLARKALAVDSEHNVEEMSIEQQREYVRTVDAEFDTSYTKEQLKKLKKNINNQFDSLKASIAAKESSKERKYSRKGKPKSKEPRGTAKSGKCGLDTTTTEDIDYVVGLYISPVNEEYGSKIIATKKVIDSLKYFTSPKSIEKLITKLNTEKEAVRSDYTNSIATKQEAIDDLSAIVTDNMKTLGSGNNTFQTSQWRYNGDAVRTAKRCFIEAGVED